MCLKRHQKTGVRTGKSAVCEHFVNESCFFLVSNCCKAQYIVYVLLSILNLGIASHTPHGDGNRFTSRCGIIGESLQLTPHTGTETQTTLSMATRFISIAAHTPHGDGNLSALASMYASLTIATHTPYGDGNFVIFLQVFL